MAAASPNRPPPSLPPGLRPRKWTTQVNIALVIAVLALLVIGGIIAWRAWKRQGEQPVPQGAPVMSYPLFPLFEQPREIPT